MPKISSLTSIPAIDTANDVLPIVDASTSTTCKVSVATLLAAGGGGGGGGSNSYDVWAADIIPAITNGPSSNTSETSTNKVGYDTVDFDQTTEESATVLVRTPTGWTGSTFTASVTWTADSGTGGVVWGISARLLANDDPIDSAFGTEVTSTDTLIATGDLHESPTTAAITPGGTAAASRVMVLKLARKTSNESDTLTADARMIGLRIYW
jgi:hypothetical protein